MRSRSWRLVLGVTASLVVAFSSWATAAPGDLDPSFGGGDGKVVEDFGGSAAANSVAVDGAGRLVVVGSAGPAVDTRLMVARFRPGGGVDGTFGGGDGVATAEVPGGTSAADAVELLPSGKILAAGWFVSASGTDGFLVARFRSNGAIDESFGGGDGTTITRFGVDAYGYGLEVMPDGGFVVVGQTYVDMPSPTADVEDFAIARYLPRGRLDTGFSSDGKVTTDFGGGSDGANGVAVQRGKILAVGWGGGGVGPVPGDVDVAVARYLPSGGLDASFAGGDAKALRPLSTTTSDSAVDVVVLRTGKFVVGAAVSAAGGGGDPAVARFTRRGRLDVDFGAGDGFTTADAPGNQVVTDLVRLGARFYVGGWTQAVDSDTGFFLTRFKSAGRWDSAFGTAGVATADFGVADSAGGIAAQGGEIVQAGRIYDAATVQNDVALARYLTA